MALLSIVVPVYNVAPYLKDGLDSILNQDVQDIEVICINDGSTDESLSILNTYKHKDKRVRVISQENKGVSAARNKGIKNASGPFITFFDPDDIVSKDMYDHMLKKCFTYELDTIICAYKTTLSETPIINKFCTNKVVSPNELFSFCNDWHSSNALCFSWRMIFKTELIKRNNINYNEDITIGEDALFNMEVLCHSKKVYYYPEPLYCYRITELSSMAQKYKPNLEKSLELQFEGQKALLNNIKDIHLPKDDFYEDIVKRYTLMLFNNLRNNPNEPNKLQGIKRILKMPMIREAMKTVGFKNIYPTWKEYVFYLAMKYQCTKIVYKIYGF